MTIDEKYANLTDEELAALAKDNDEGAAELLFRKYKDVIRGRGNLYFMVGADKDDLIQEGMIGLFRAISNYNPDKQASFRTFADLCINRQMITAIKRAGRMKHSPLNTSVSIYDKYDSDENSKSIEETYPDPNNYNPEEELLFNEQVEYIEENSNEIFSKLELRVWSEYLKGKTYTEIAVLLEKTPKAIDNAIQRMKKKVEQELKTI